MTRHYSRAALLSIGKVAHQVNGAGCNASGLGQWTWMKYQGQDGISLWIICGYRPVKPSSPVAGSVYSQHKQYFDGQDRDIDPCQAWLDDLFKDITKWNKEGDQLIFIGDLNEDLNCNKLHNFLWWLGMWEVILD
jgi:hypothetical protein